MLATNCLAIAAKNAKAAGATECYTCDGLGRVTTGEMCHTCSGLGVDILTLEYVNALAHIAVGLGAVDSYDDCPGGDIRAPEGATDACMAVVNAYKSAACTRYWRVHGPELRYYYGRPD